MIHYINDIIMIGPIDQELATALDFLVRHLHVREWDKLN